MSARRRVFLVGQPEDNPIFKTCTNYELDDQSDDSTSLIPYGNMMVNNPQIYNPIYRKSDRFGGSEK